MKDFCLMTAASLALAIPDVRPAKRPARGFDERTASPEKKAQRKRQKAARRAQR